MKQKITLILLCFVTAFTAAHADDVIIEAPHFRTIDAAERTVFYNVTLKGATGLTATSSDSWLTVASVSDTQLKLHASANSLSSSRTATITLSAGSVSQTFTLTQDGNGYSDAGLSSLASTKATVSRGAAYVSNSSTPSGSGTSTAASESPFTNSYDGDVNTFYHSAYGSGQALAQYSYVDMCWTLSANSNISYITYSPRPSSNLNGSVGQCEIWYSTGTSGSFTKYGEYDFGMTFNPSTVSFNSNLSVRRIILRVKTGYNNHASCGEIEFGMTSSTFTSFNSLFKDEIWSGLADGVTETQINAISNQFVKRMAQEMYAGTYDYTWRVQNMKCFRSPSKLSEEWNAPGKYYDQLGNVTGIHVPSGTSIAVWIPTMPSSETSVGYIMRAWYRGISTAGLINNSEQSNYMFIDTSGGLHQGLNVITNSLDRDALLYVTYFTGDADPTTHADIPVHFLNAPVNGYLALTDPQGNTLTNAQMKTICQNAPNYNIDVVGDKFHGVWEPRGMLSYCKDVNGNADAYRAYIRAMDWFVDQEHEVMGFKKYNRVPNTRTLAYINYHYYMYQSTAGVSFINTEQQYLLNLKFLFKNGSSDGNFGWDKIWGLSHEWGHQHQMRPYFNWAGCDEMSNNVKSYWNTTRAGYSSGYGHGADVATGTALYNGVVSSGYITSGDNTTYTSQSNARTYAKNNVSTFSWSNSYTTLINNTPEDWTTQTKGSVTSYDYTNYATVRPFVALAEYAINVWGKPDFLPDLYEALRQTDATSGSTIVGSTIEKSSGVDKYELLAAAQNGSTAAYNQFRSAYSGSVWYSTQLLNSSHLAWDVNSVPFIFNYIRKASRLTGYNLFPYFEKCGLLRQVAWRAYNGPWYLMTSGMYDEFKSDMNSLGLNTLTDANIKTILQYATPSFSTPTFSND